ncbi:HD-GYP domain-containing protein [Paenibacillus sp. 2TAB26]|uniref:HD-GYP domain-containing protein n=1 Tax=Paenibacillus sp. 2TAB26 TaxID=3233005 RepID=UPI003F9C5BA6
MIFTISTLAKIKLPTEMDTLFATLEGFENIYSLTKALFECLKVRDSLTADHSLSMAILTYEMALKFDTANAPLYYTGALTHDIGKLGMIDRILKGSGKLNEGDHTYLKAHVTSGYEILMNLNMPKIMLDVVKYHHEKFDGSGYLEGLCGYDIPLPGRIASITDTYSALTSQRNYSKPLNKEEAVRIMLKDRKQFDPDLLRYFVSNIISIEMERKK